uniref:F-box domain-containing protein n=1 Tax=Setaria italica TaxID=4555 RepID=K3YKZ9_SETIT
MVPRQHPPSLAVLPTEVAIEIIGHLAATSEQPMDDLRSLWATCSFMLRMCGDPAVGRHVALDRFSRAMLWNKPDGYDTLLASLTQVGNPEACFLTGIQVIFRETHSPRLCLDDLARAAAGGLNVAAYLVALFLYRDNGGASDDDTARRYMRRVQGEEESWVAAAVD